MPICVCGEVADACVMKYHQSLFHYGVELDVAKMIGCECFSTISPGFR